MKKSILLLSVLAMSASLYAQQDQGRVGINTTSPKATLDISKEGVDDAKGLLIPRLTADEVKTMTDANKIGEDQNSLLLYVTQPFTELRNRTGKYRLIHQAGYYYYDTKEDNGMWVPISGNKKNIYEITEETYLLPEHNNSFLYVNSDENINIYLSDYVGLPLGFNCVIVQEGNGQVFIVPDGTFSMKTARGYKTRTQYSAIGIIVNKPNTFTITGDAVN
ncbi:hypothetical protein [Riemerella columbina]|uniref:hypothetical protein n=1 Tax=Riemerella columbina TaxID=103810 RepID=UPI00035EB04D|nr:hypothetical protein [Riemerella columbina]